MNHEPMDVLVRIRPAAAVDRAWDAHDQNAVRESILADRAATLAPAGRVRSLRPTRSVAIAGAVAAAVVLAPGAAAALGDGLRAQSFFDAYSYWSENPGGAVDAAHVERIATAPGPDGNVFSVLTATNSDGTTCLAPIIESPASADSEAPNLFTDGGAVCASPDAGPQTVGATFVGPTDSAVVLYGYAGEATRAEVRTPDGETYPVIIAKRYLFGWYPLPVRTPDRAPTLYVFAADGSVVHSSKLR